MANIKEYTDQIAQAVYGEEVRGSIINALNKVNDDNDSYAALKAEVVQMHSEVVADTATVSAAVSSIGTSVEDAAASATSAGNSASQASQSKTDAHGFRNEAETFRNQAEQYAKEAGQAAGGDFVTHAEVGSTVASLVDGKVPTAQLPDDLGTKDYDSLENRPSINGHVLTGNQSTSDLGLFSGNYDDLENKPTIPPAYELPIATTSELGGVKPDGETITVDENGVISSVGGGSSSDWELIGSVTGSNSVAIDSTKYKEFLVEQNYNNNVISHNVATIELSTTKKQFYGGYMRTTSSNYRGACIICDTSSIMQVDYYANGSAQTANSSMTVYGRK